MQRDDKKAMNEGHSYANRSAQIKEEFNTFKRNHKGDNFADIIEGEPLMPQVGRQLIGFMKSIPHKAKEVYDAYTSFLFG